MPGKRGIIALLDGWARNRLDPLIDALARRLAARGASANAITVASCVVGLLAAGAIALEAYLAGLALILLSRLGDGLDGAVAKIRGRTDLGGYLDIVLDFTFYGAVPLGFVLADPAQNAVAGAVLLLSFYVNGASFLAYAAIAERRGLAEEPRGLKSIHFTTGLMEATETILFFCAFCLFPAWFAPLALIFAALCFYTASARIILAVRRFRD